MWSVPRRLSRSTSASSMHKPPAARWSSALGAHRVLEDDPVDDEAERSELFLLALAVALALWLVSALVACDHAHRARAVRGVISDPEPASGAPQQLPFYISVIAEQLRERRGSGLRLTPDPLVTPTPRPAHARTARPAARRSRAAPWSSPVSVERVICPLAATDMLPATRNASPPEHGLLADIRDRRQATRECG